MSAKPKTAALPALPALHPKRLCLVVRRLVCWLREYRVTLATITVTVTRDPASPAERELRELALDHSLDARQLLAWLEEGGLVLRRMVPKLPDPPRASTADALEDACRDPGGGSADALCSERDGSARGPVGGKSCERKNGPLTSPAFRPYGPHHQTPETVAAQGLGTGSAGSLRCRQGEARCGR